MPNGQWNTEGIRGYTNCVLKNSRKNKATSLATIEEGLRSGTILYIRADAICLTLQTSKDSDAGAERPPKFLSGCLVTGTEREKGPIIEKNTGVESNYLATATGHKWS